MSSLEYTGEMEELYEELCTCKDSLHDKCIFESTLDASQKCIKVFPTRGVHKLKELQQLLSFVLSVPGSNAFVEHL